MHGLTLDDADQRLLILVRHEPRQQFRGGGDRCDRVAQLVREHGEELVLAAITLLQRRLQPALLGDVPRGADHVVASCCEQRDDEVATGELALVAHDLTRLQHMIAALDSDCRALRHQFAQSSAENLLARQIEDGSGVTVGICVDPVDDRPGGVALGLQDGREIGRMLEDRLQLRIALGQCLLMLGVELGTRGAQGRIDRL